MSLVQTREFTTARLREFAQIAARQGITFVLFVAAFGNLENILDQAQYVSLLLTYNYGLLICGVSLLGYPTVLQHRFSLRSTAALQTVHQLTVSVLVALAISLGAVFLISFFRDLPIHVNLVFFLFCYTLFTQLLSISFGKGNVFSINLAELLGVTVFFVSTMLVTIEGVNQAFVVVAFSYGVRCTVLLFYLLRRSRVDLDRPPEGTVVSKLSFWQVSAVSAINIFLFRSILPILEQHNISAKLVNPLILAWPIIERVLSLTATSNAILYRYIARDEINSRLKSIFQGLLAMITLGCFIFAWIAYGYIYGETPLSDVTYILILGFLFFWSLKSFQANVFVAIGRVSILLPLITFQLLVILGLYACAALNAKFGIEWSLAVICLMLLITYVIGAIVLKNIKLEGYHA